MGIHLHRLSRGCAIVESIASASDTFASNPSSLYNRLEWLPEPSDCPTGATLLPPAQPTQGSFSLVAGLERVRVWSFRTGYLSVYASKCFTRSRLFTYRLPSVRSTPADGQTDGELAALWYRVGWTHFEFHSLRALSQCPSPSGKPRRRRAQWQFIPTTIVEEFGPRVDFHHSISTKVFQISFIANVNWINLHRTCPLIVSLTQDVLQWEKI